MKPGKLYLKIFLSFVLILIITVILIFGLFIFSTGRDFRSRFEQYTIAKALIAKELLEEKIKSRPETQPAENELLKDYINRLGEIYKAKVWLANPDGTPLLKSFSGDIPPYILELQEKHSRNFGDSKIYHGFRRGWEFYTALPAEIGKTKKGTLHMLFEKTDRSHPEKGFALGLAAIAVVIALLTIPVSRMITKRVKGLTQSALQIADGDLSHRVMVKGKDEIGELGRSFNRMADKLERMIRGGRELTANISHELRSPLARVRVAEELLKEKLKRGEYEGCYRHLDEIREDVNELDHLIGRILTLSKLDIHETVLETESINLSGLLNGLLEHFRPIIERKGLHITTDLSFDPSILGNEDALRTAVSNILDNAIKFTHKEGTIAVEMHSEQDFLKISVTNSFEPLSEEDLTGIFEPFYRTEQSPESGSGLGLAIAKKIIEKHGGMIESLNANKGLKIQVCLPTKA
ncbi:MAG: HAMP domain-containing histidine kinase [Deltaproteobacteria bacterium]|nr:HAMP domain-containing histidine kinase [Deltaproteobacteria bacterium]